MRFRDRTLRRAQQLSVATVTCPLASSIQEDEGGATVEMAVKLLFILFLPALSPSHCPPPSFFFSSISDFLFLFQVKEGKVNGGQVKKTSSS